MSDILNIAKFDAGIQTPSGLKQFSATDAAGELIINREYKESFDKFKSGCTCGDSYIWRVLSAVADQTGLILYDNVKNYIDYITNVDVCKVQSLRSMVKMYGLEYKVFDRLDLLPVEVLDLINIFSINKKHLIYGEKLLEKYKDTLLAEGVLSNYLGVQLADSQTSAVLSSTVLNCDCLDGGQYRNFMVDSFESVLNGFLSLPYSEGGAPIYSIEGEWGVYEELARRRDKYALQYVEGTVEYDRRQYKMLNGVSLRFDECAALDRIEAGLELESDYQGFELKLIQMERELRQKSQSGDKTSRYAFYKKQRVLEYANFVTDKYFSDHKCTDLSVYKYDNQYFEVIFESKGSVEDPGQMYEKSGKNVIYRDDASENLQIDSNMVRGVAESLADTSLYISRIREKIKLQTRKNYMKGTYDLMLYVINEFLVDYSRLNPIFRDDSNLSNATSSVSQLLWPIYQDLSSHDINNLTAIEYFDETEYYNISAATDTAGHDGRYSSSGVNDRFWHYPAGEWLMQHDGIDRDFDIGSIKSFYMDTLGIRDNYISDDNALCAFLDAVFNLGAVESFIHSVSADVDGKESAHELFGAQVEKYGHYSDDLYMGYLGVKRAWQTFSSYLSGNEYEYQVSDCVSAQVLSVADYIKQLILKRELSAVSAVYDAYIDRVDQLSILVDQGIEQYNDLISGEYTFYFKKQDSYKYCLEDPNDPESYKHHWYISSTYDAGLEYWYDMIQAINEYASGSDDYGEHITNWPIRDTIEYFYSEFKKLSGWYVDMTTGIAVPGIGMDIMHDWSQEYGFVDISAVSLEDELKYGYDFIQAKIRERTEYITNMLNSLKQQAIQMQNLSQSIKNALTQALASYDDQRGDSKLGDSSVWCVSLNEYDNGYPSDGYKTYETSRCKRQEDKPGTTYNFAVEQRVGTKKLWYFCAAPNADGEYKTGNYAFSEQSIPPYNEDDDILSRCAAIKAYMQAPTSFILVREKSDDLKWYDETLNYDMMDEGVFASISQVEADYANLTNQVDSIINQLEKLGYTFSKDEDIDETITNLIDFINTEVDEDAIGNDEKIQVYKKYFRAVIQLSSLYLPVKYEYDSISKDQNQRAYLSEFTPDNDMTLATLDRLSSYSVDKDRKNKETILGSISQMRQRYDEVLSAYQDIAEQLAQEYMLPQSFQPYAGYIEEMVLLMYEALRNDVDEKIYYAHNIADKEYLDKIAPAASELIARLAQYVNSVYPLPDAVNKRLRELYYFDEPSYIRQKEMFLTYGGRSFCYYPYYNFKNVVHSSYQVHPFLWNFIRRESASNVVRKTFYSVNVDELERANIAQNWRKFFGDYGESKYLDLSKPRYPDYSGYQSRYEDSNHVADNTQFVSEVVDYDGAFYPPAVEWLRVNGITKAISSIQDTKYNKKIAEELQTAISDLSSLEWNVVLSTLSSATSAYCTQAQVDSLISYVYEQPNCYNSGKRALSDITLYEVYSAVKGALSGESTFYGRFYRQLRLDQVQQRANKEYIINQLSSYWEQPILGGGPSIQDITKDAPLNKAFDIYKYGIDSYGNMYCLYKQYDSDIVLDTAVRGGLSYKYKQSTPGSLWIRLKNHPLAFPAFSGRYPNIYLETTNKRHVAFANLLNLRYWNTKDEKGDDRIGDDIYTKLSATGAAEAASCIYDFEFTKNRNDVTFVTKMHSYDLTCDSKDIQCYQNSWLVHCRPDQEVLSSENGPGRTVLKLYSPADETDYYQSGEDYRQYSALSVLSALDGAGITLYQYIGSYLKGDNGIYHAYAMQHVYRGAPDDGRYMTLSDSVSCITRDVIDEIKIYPSINGKYKDEFTITGRLVEDGGLSVTGSDICLAYDEENNIVNFAAQTVLAPSSAVRADVGLIGLSSNAKGTTIDDPSGDEMNSHDIFDTNVTFFRKQVVSYRLRDVRSSGNAKYEFNTNADMSYFPVYPGFAGVKKLYMRPQYEHYNVELLGMAKDISQQISYVNPQPDPYLDADTILSNFANARVYQDYTGYIDETFKTVDNKLIGVNSDALSRGWVAKTVKDQQVVCRDDFMVWQIGLDRLYQNFDINSAMKLKVLMFSRKCYGKNPYMFADISALANGWVDLNYDPVGDNFDGYSVISAADYIFGYGNRVLAQSTLDGVETTAVGDSNHIYNIKSAQARLVVDETSNAMTLEVRFCVDDIRMASYTYVPAGDLQVAFLDVRNLDVFNYFHYLDAYGAIRFLDFFKTQEYLNRFLTKRGEGYTIYYRGYEFTEEDLMNRLRSYYEYMNRMVPLSSVDLSQYDCLSDVYILQGSRRLQFKVDEDFRYELDHPGYFYPTVNAKFPMNPAQYAMQMTSFKENAASDMLVGLFGQNNLFLLDMEDPAATLGNMGRIDIPILLDDQEYVFAYEEYMDYAEGELSSRRNCDLYDVSDPRVLQFVQFESDSDASRGVPANIAQTHQAFDIPNSQVSTVSMETALIRVSEYAASEVYGVDGVYPVFAESGRSGYAQEYIGFTLDGGSFSREQVEELSRIYVNYRKCEDGGDRCIQLYFNYMNYLNSPYLRVQDGHVYVDLVDNTYLSLKPDEDGVLDIVTQFRYYKGGTLCGYRNVKLASYQIYNISDDKPKFLIKNIDRLERDDGSNKTVQPRVAVRICNVELDAESSGGEGSKMAFDLMFDIETSAPLKQIEFYVDYPSDFMEFTSTTGDGWSLNNDQPGYAKLTVDASTRFVSIPANTTHTKGELADMGDQNVMVYVDEPVIVGENGLYADLATTAGRINVFVSQVTGRLDVLLTDSYSSQPTVNVFNTEYSRSNINGFILAK